jgi:hypothetical protein
MQASKIGDIGLLKEVLFVEEHPWSQFHSDGANIYLNDILLVKAIQKDIFLIQLLPRRKD